MPVPKQVITGKWTTALGSGKEHLGIVTLHDTFLLRFPMLRAFEDIPGGTTVLWGTADDLRKCTAITLPCPPPATAYSQQGQWFSLQTLVTRLLLGNDHVEDPTSDFVTEISFTPWPNHDLHVQQLYEFMQPSTDIASITFSPACEPKRQQFATALWAYFLPEHEAQFVAPAPSQGATITAWIAGSGSWGNEFGHQTRIIFSLQFTTPYRLETAIEEALKFCALLSFLAHQYIYPTDLHVRVKGENGAPYELHYYGLPNIPARSDTWVANTLVLPDQQPERFRQLVQEWYATNEDFLPSRYLYRQTLEKPFLYSAERFLGIFRALESHINMAGYQFLTSDELQTAEDALRTALSTTPKLEPLIRKLRGTNTQSPKHVLKQELPKLFATANITPTFDTDEFVDRIYDRRNKTAHGGSHFQEASPDALMNDTLLLTAIYILIESGHMSLDVQEALKKFRSAFDCIQLPLSVPSATPNTTK